MDGSDYTYVNMISLGPFLSYVLPPSNWALFEHLSIRLSAYLFEETNEARYQQAAQLSLAFIVDHLWNGTLAYDGLYLSSCQIFPKPLSANQAWFIEGEYPACIVEPQLKPSDRPVSMGEHNEERYLDDTVSVVCHRIRPIGTNAY